MSIQSCETLALLYHGLISGIPEEAIDELPPWAPVSTHMGISISRVLPRRGCWRIRMLCAV